MELRKELAAVTELDLPPMLVFDYPTVAALTDHLLTLMPPQPATIEQPATVRRRLFCIRLGYSYRPACVRVSSPDSTLDN